MEYLHSGQRALIEGDQIILCLGVCSGVSEGWWSNCGWWLDDHDACGACAADEASLVTLGYDFIVKVPTFLGRSIMGSLMGSD